MAHWEKTNALTVVQEETRNESVHEGIREKEATAVGYGGKKRKSVEQGGAATLHRDLTPN